MQTITYTGQDNRIYTYQIECLKGKDVLLTRPLWEEVFSEDSPAFTEYYFQTKAAFNTTFIATTAPDEIISMVHLTPYEITIKGKTYPTFYIVGVATKKSHRHRGLMSALLNHAFEHAKSLHCPFVFLMPANPAIYEPFGFSYIYSRPQYDVPEMTGKDEVYINQFPLGDINIHRIEETASAKELEALSDFASRTLAEQFDYYLTRTPSYYETLLSELKSQNGYIYAFTLDGQLEGYFLYAREDNKPFIQEVLFSNKLQAYLRTFAEKNGTSSPAVSGLSDRNIMSTLFPVEQPQKKPIIMAKNLNDSQHNKELSAASLPTSASLHNIDYVNFLSHHKGIINELV